MAEQRLGVSKNQPKYSEIFQILLYENAMAEQIYRFGPFMFDSRRRVLLKNDAPVSVGQRALVLLETLLAADGKAVSKSTLMDAAWQTVNIEESNLTVQMAALRKCLGKSRNGEEWIATVQRMGYQFVNPDQPVVVGANDIPNVSGSDRKPVIAVLPFENLSGDPSQQYFSDGITHDIIDRLSKFRILAVIGHHSSFAFRGRDADIQGVRDKLTADYVLTGNIRKSENRIRVAARLTDARTERAIWADQYDRPLHDIFAIQDEVASIIASTLMGRVEIEIVKRSPAVSSASISSYENVLLGIWHFKKLTLESNTAAARCFEKAIAAYPENAEAHQWLARSHNNTWLTDFAKEGFAKGLHEAVRSIDLDPTSAGGYAVRGFCQLYLTGPKSAMESLETALSLNPGEPDILIEFGLLHVYGGNLQLGRSYFDRAFQLNPLPPLWYPEFRSIAAFVESGYEDALPAFVAIPDAAWDTMYAMSCMGHLGLYEQAAACRARYLAAGKKWDLIEAAKAEPYANPDPRQRLVAGLEKALGT